MTDEPKKQEIRGKAYHVDKRSKHGKPRFIVDGVMHPAGILPIRFKSLNRAERHMANHGIGK